MITQGHDSITTMEDFNKRFGERFDRKGPEIHFRDLAQLKQESKVDDFCSRISKACSNGSGCNRKKIHCPIY